MLLCLTLDRPPPLILWLEFLFSVIIIEFISILGEGYEGSEDECDAPLKESDDVPLKNT